MYTRTLEITDSSNVKEIKYDIARKRAVVAFMSGESYIYENVSPLEFGSIASADSVGKAVNVILVQSNKALKI